MVHKDVYRDVECVVPLRKELVENSRMLDTTTTQMSSQQVSYLGSSSKYVTLLLSGTLIKHGVNEVLTDKKEGAKQVGHWSTTQLLIQCSYMRELLGVTGFDRLPIINTISQRDNCKLR